jgi:hypothetical protein
MTRAWGSASARRASSPPARRTPRAAPSGPTSTASTGRPVSMRAPSRSAAWHARRRGPHRHRRARACLLALPPPARPRMPWCRTGGGRRRQQVGMQCQRWAYNAMREGGPHLRQLAADGAHAAADHHPGPLRARQAALARAPDTALTGCCCTLEPHLCHNGDTRALAACLHAQGIFPAAHSMPWADNNDTRQGAATLPRTMLWHRKFRPEPGMSQVAARPDTPSVTAYMARSRSLRKPKRCR